MSIFKIKSRIFQESQNLFWPRIGNHWKGRVTNILAQKHVRYSTDAEDGTKKLTNILKAKFPKAKQVEVADISGGCGAMYEIFVESVEFKGLSIVKQHRLINDTLKEEIKDMHGLRIQTSVPTENG